jgi:Tfp pilus assembly protein PilX
MRSMVRSAVGGYDKGGVSIFVVVFTALMVTIVTASFVQIVLRNQQIASNNDLSQSAYDSAMAGVEDAKRALVKLSRCENDPVDSCETAIRTALDSNECDSLQSAGVVTFDSTTNEVQVGGSEQNQAYTCVKVTLDTEDFSKTLDESGVPVVVPLKGRNEFNKIRLSWFSVEDLPEDEGGVTMPLEVPSDATTSLPGEDEWSATSPPIMRAQLIQFNRNDIQLSQFADGNSRTLFLYPISTGPSAHSFATDARASSVAANSPKPTVCNEAMMTSEAIGYACSVVLDLPNPIGGSQSTREAYLQLQSVYNTTSFKVELLNDDNNVRFNGVQPSVDSTGRASDFFRRVRAKLSVTEEINPFLPNAALTTDSNLCKEFFITDKPNEYESDCSPDEL